MTMTMPQSRPALRRAPDADVHPALVIPLQTGLRASPEPTPVETAARVAAPAPIPIAASPVDGDRAAGKKSGKKAKAHRAKKAKKAKKAKAQAVSAAAPALGSRFQGAGRATSDAVLFEPDRRVPLSVLVPKAVRDEIRDVARLSGTTQDRLVSELLLAALADPRKW